MAAELTKPALAELAEQGATADGDDTSSVAAAAMLAVDLAAAKAKEDGKVGATREPIGAGRVAALTLDLTPGSYVLLCNVAGHYQLGMHAPLRVE